MPQTPSHDAALEFPAIRESGLFYAGQVLANFGFFGLIWLDGALNVVSTYGQLVDFVETGKPVCDSILALVGLENDILALAATPGKILELPAISVAEESGKTHKINFTIFWDERFNVPMLLAYRSNALTGLELELSRQIRARLMAEEEVKQKSKELERANADLESFASIVSHDLKAPLRHMRYLSESAASAAAAGNAARASEMLGEVSMQAQRMSRMLTELFDYSSLGRKTEALETVNTADLIASICASLPQSQHRIAISGTWPSIVTMRAPLCLVMHNLITNAIKHHDRDGGLINVSCSAGDMELTLEVSDDGPGIEPHHHGAIFLPFRTLTGTSPESTGLGLAMVKKTVESVGGSIQVSSNPDVARGTKFTVIWPRAIVA